MTQIRDCLFCGSTSELQECQCGEPVFMNLNDIDYAFFVSCPKCYRCASATGGSPEQNHDECVRRWNAREVEIWSPEPVSESHD